MFRLLGIFIVASAVQFAEPSPKTNDSKERKVNLRSTDTHRIPAVKHNVEKGPVESTLFYVCKISGSPMSTRLNYITGFEGNTNKYALYAPKIGDGTTFNWVSTTAACVLACSKMADSGWAGPFDNVYLDDQCSVVAGGNSASTLEACKTGCGSASGCTAINWAAANSTCQYRNCAAATTNPTSVDSSWQSYRKGTFIQFYFEGTMCYMSETQYTIETTCQQDYSKEVFIKVP